MKSLAQARGCRQIRAHRALFSFCFVRTFWCVEISGLLRGNVWSVGSNVWRVSYAYLRLFRQELALKGFWKYCILTRSCSPLHCPLREKLTKIFALFIVVSVLLFRLPQGRKELYHVFLASGSHCKPEHTLTNSILADFKPVVFWLMLYYQ